METISIVKLLKFVKIKSLIYVHLKTSYTYDTQVYSLYVKENVHNYWNLIELSKKNFKL